MQKSIRNQLKSKEDEIKMEIIRTMGCINGSWCKEQDWAHYQLFVETRRFRVMLGANMKNTRPIQVLAQSHNLRELSAMFNVPL